MRGRSRRIAGILRFLRSFDPHRAENEPYGLACDLWQPSAMPRADRHQEIEVNFSPHGALGYRIAGRRVMVPAGRLALFWAAVPHQLTDWSCERPYWVLTVPAARFLALGLPDGFVARVLAGELLWDARLTARDRDAERFERWSWLVRRDATTALSELRKRLGEFAEGPLESSLESEPLPSHAKVARMARIVALRHVEPLLVADIASAVGLHPHYAMELFRREFGTTLNQTLTLHRVGHAMRLLATTDLPVATIRAASGFGSSSRFNEAFSRLCGQSPRAFRRGCRTTGRTLGG